MKLKKILGCIAAAGMSIGGLILAGKSEFGKNFGKAPEPEYDPDEFDDLHYDDAAPEESETTEEAEPESEE